MLEEHNFLCCHSYERTSDIKKTIKMSAIKTHGFIWIVLKTDRKDKIIVSIKILYILKLLKDFYVIQAL